MSAFLHLNIVFSGLLSSGPLVPFLPIVIVVYFNILVCLLSEEAFSSNFILINALLFERIYEIVCAHCDAFG